MSLIENIKNILNSALQESEGTSNGVGRTVIDQINKLDKDAGLRWGRKNVVYHKDGVSFDTSGYVKWKGKVIIRLNRNDTYDIKMGKLKGVNMTGVKEFKDVPVENLVQVISSIVE